MMEKIPGQQEEKQCRQKGRVAWKDLQSYCVYRRYSNVTTNHRTNTKDIETR